MTNELAAYERADSCDPYGPDGCKSLLKWNGRYLPEGWSGGICDCRDARGTSTRSIHSECRALDFMLPVGPDGKGTEAGHRLVQKLLAHAKWLGIQAIIYDRMIWSAKSPNGRAYNGVHPHYDHLHIELNRNAGKNLNYATLVAVLGDPTSEDENMDVTTGKDDPAPSLRNNDDLDRNLPYVVGGLADWQDAAREALGVSPGDHSDYGSIDGEGGAKTFALTQAFESKFFGTGGRGGGRVTPRHWSKVERVVHQEKHHD